MKVKELVGKEIMNAYDGNYLAKDFGYSCANFNVKNSFGGGQNWRFFEEVGFGSGDENTPESFDFYTLNTKNISCFVCYNNEGKIWGRRMFYKGESMINDEEFTVPIKKGEQVKYLYGYYGSHMPIPQEAIYKAVMKKYGEGIIYTDREALKDGARDHTIPRFWVMGVERADFPLFPPIDHLQVSPELKALANFEPKRYILEVLEKDFGKPGAEFHSAYRFSPRKKYVKYDYKTWADHQGVIKSSDDFTKVVQPEEEDDDWTKDLEEGDRIRPKSATHLVYIVTMVGDINILAKRYKGGKSDEDDKGGVKLKKSVIKEFFELA